MLEYLKRQGQLFLTSQSVRAAWCVLGGSVVFMVMIALLDTNILRATRVKTTPGPAFESPALLLMIPTLVGYSIGRLFKLELQAQAGAEGLPAASPASDEVGQVMSLLVKLALTLLAAGYVFLVLIALNKSPFSLIPTLTTADDPSRGVFEQFVHIVPDKPADLALTILWMSVAGFSMAALGLQRLITATGRVLIFLARITGKKVA